MIDIKSEAIALIEKMPDGSTLDDIMEELYFKAQVDEGLRQLDNGGFISHDDVKQRISKWIIK